MLTNKNESNVEKYRKIITLLKKTCRIKKSKCYKNKLKEENKSL